jgi:phenylalanyl-tRNA synthetase alpha chain
MLDKGVQKMLADGGSLRVIVPGRTFRIDNDAPTRRCSTRSRAW